ncbi:serine hydrolase domain-containing protein [Chryseolinea soli]|uniref:Class A beta-lactamase-related serine hydrolase n=1 Tax=Chryseolinea soli TaxID=2321403 RepID=A0A385SWL9_9BACT|nr:serine hydrolase domain-containing protein [Chryseolinea soli]AYB35242.1 class A beta-lactamase-related serine hydrolase [Chryseolinea soli]
MKKDLFILLLLLLAVCLPPAVRAQKITPATTPEAAGFSSERLKRLDTNFNDWVAKGWMNGAVALVIHDGKIVYYKAFGYNDMATKAPLAKDGIFRIASQTKAITSVAVMMLHEEGKFLLDDPVSKYIPTFAKAKVLVKYNAKDTTYTSAPAKRDITIRDLLTHTSGLDYSDIGSDTARAIYAKNKLTAGLYVTDDNLVAAMSRLGTLPLMHNPGERWIYGLNIDVLGALVEIWSGMSLDDFFRTRIFEPLGMSDTYFNIPPAKANRLVNFFREDSTGHIVKEPYAFGRLDMSYPLHKKTYFSGGGGLSSTIFDYGIFLQMMLNGGTYNGVRLLSPTSVRLMTMNQIGNLSLGDGKFGLGFSVLTEAGSPHSPAKPGTYGWGGAFSTTYYVDPASKLVVLLYRQMWGSHMGEMSGKFDVLVYQALKE